MALVKGKIDRPGDPCDGVRVRRPYGRGAELLNVPL